MFILECACISQGHWLAESSLPEGAGGWPPVARGPMLRITIPL